jgi:hypothetical protein
VAGIDDVVSQRFYESGLADTGHSGNSEADRTACVGYEFFQKRARCHAVIGARGFDQRDGLRQCSAVSFQHTFSQFLLHAAIPAP